MRISRKIALALFVVILSLGNLAHAQVIKQVPANAMVVFKIANLEATSKKIADLATSLGLAQLNPQLNDPLGAVLQQMHATAGVNKAGDMAFALLSPDAVGGNMDKAVLILIPVTDYQAFLGNFPDAKTDGGVSEVKMGDSPDPGYVVHWGNYAAVSPSKDYMSKKPTEFISINDQASKEIDNKDFVVLANFKQIRPLVLPQLDGLQQTAMAGIDQTAQQNPVMGNINLAKLAPVLKVIANQALKGGREFINDIDTATLSANISPEGIATTFMATFLPESYLGKMYSQVKDTSDSLLGGLPEGKYLMFGGSTGDPKLAIQMLNDIVGPIEKAIADLGPDYASLQTVIDLAKQQIAVQTGQTWGVIAPTAGVGQEPLFQMMAVRRGDSKVIIDVGRKMIDVQTNAMKAIGVDNGNNKTTFTPGIKTVDGVSFDQILTTFDLSAAGAQGAQAAQILNLIYGQNGMSALIGAVDPNNTLITIGLNDKLISSAILAVKKNDDPLARSNSVKAIAAQLPSQHVAVMYLPLDIWASTGIFYAKQFGLDTGVKLPDDLPPIGVSIGTEGSSVRMDTYIPAQLTQAMISAGMQIGQAVSGGAQPNNGPAPQRPPAGGL